MVELAVVFPLLALLAFGVTDLARAYTLRVDVANDVEIAARALSVSPTATTPTPRPGCSWTVSPNPLPTAPPVPATALATPIAVTETCAFSALTPLLSRAVGSVSVVSKTVVRSQW